MSKFTSWLDQQNSATQAYFRQHPVWSNEHMYFGITCGFVCGVIVSWLVVSILK